HTDMQLRHMFVIASNLNTVEQVGGEVALRRGGCDGDDSLACAGWFAGDRKGRVEGGAGGDADGNPLQPRAVPRGLHGVSLRYRQHARDVAHVEDAGAKTWPDALDLMRARIIAREYRALGGFDGDHLHRGPSRLWGARQCRGGGGGPGGPQP